MEAHRAVAGERRAGMIGVVGQAIRGDELLVECCLAAGQPLAPGSEQADACRRVGGDTAFCRRALERQVAGKAIIGDGGMGGLHRAGRQHRFRPKDRQQQDAEQHDQDEQGSRLRHHCQSQNSAVATRCAVASTAKASVIGTGTTRPHLIKIVQHRIDQQCRQRQQRQRKGQNFTTDQAGGARHARSLRSSIGLRMRHRH